MKLIRTDAILELLLVGKNATIIIAHANKLIEYRMQKMKNKIGLTFINNLFTAIIVTIKLVTILILI